MMASTTISGNSMTVSEATAALTAGLQSIYGSCLDRVILYGSTARGTASPDSDVDIAVLLRPGTTSQMYDRLLDLVVDLELACSRVLSVVRIDAGKFAAWENVSPFYRNINREGVVLWKAV